MYFLDKSDILEMHKRAIEMFGGSHGILNEGELESALIAAENRQYYEEANLAICAATYAYHLTKAHVFIDGNKRTAAIATRTFLLINNADIDATEDEKYNLFIGIASGIVTRAQVEEFICSSFITTT